MVFGRHGEDFGRLTLMPVSGRDCAGPIACRPPPQIDFEVGVSNIIIPIVDPDTETTLHLRSGLSGLGGAVDKRNLSRVCCWVLLPQKRSEEWQGPAGKECDMLSLVKCGHPRGKKGSRCASVRSVTWQRSRLAYAAILFESLFFCLWVL